MSDKPIFSYNLDDDEQHHIYEHDLDDTSKPLADFIGASLRLKQTQEAYIDKIIDEKIKQLHELVTAKRIGAKNVVS
mgnify:CR=1 FL=1|jgi:hypothetical protein